ncbi:uncharacterized protein LOC117330529 [Pecten maximus]|uniref:uncharacterized protein LOC117330529 n=1 Tax=Pecten maximus TaxID=6579 RepID=UPI0014586305|nr:uncharacterized protein LOC117330529 [Pecten maximus]XP_033744797.1 uncharacterized protein LOC117330529 [Pecten maximus]
MVLMLIAFVLLGCVSVYDVSAVKVMELDRYTCLSTKIHKLNEYSTVHIKWGGQKLPFYCKMYFVGRSTDYELNRYRICVEVLEYNIFDCDFKLKYFIGYNIIPSKVYRCHNGYPPKFCSNEDEFLDIEFDVDSHSSSSVTLKVTASLTYDDGDLVGMTAKYVGGGIGGIVCIVIVLILLYLIYRRRHPQNNPGLLMQNIQGVNPPRPSTTVVQHTTTIPT